MSRTLLLNTAQSLNPSTPHLSFFNIPNLDMANIARYSMKINYVSFSNAVYPINRFYDTVKFTETNGGANDTYTIQLDRKQYTGTTLATELATKMTAASAANYAFTYTGTYDPATMKITISNGAILPNAFKFDSVDNNAYRELGFTSEDIASQTLRISQTSNTVIDLAGTDYVDLLSNTLSTSNISTSTTSSVLARIPLTTEFGTVISYINPSDHFWTLRNDNLETVDFTLRDSRGNLYELDSNHPVAITLEFKITAT